MVLKYPNGLSWGPEKKHLHLHWNRDGDCRGEPSRKGLNTAKSLLPRPPVASIY